MVGVRMLWMLWRRRTNYFRGEEEDEFSGGRIFLRESKISFWRIRGKGDELIGGDLKTEDFVEPEVENF